MFGSNAPTEAARLLGCATCNRATEGVTLGFGTEVGNPVEIRLAVPAGATQPEDVVATEELLIVVMQFRRNPGTLPAIAVTWKVDRVSNNQE